jgi:hypothetical protein
MALSPEEENHIRNLSLIPVALVFYVFLGYIAYLFAVNAPLPLPFIMGYFTLFFLLVFPALFHGTEQILRSRREKKPLRCYAKRFVGSMAIWLLGATAFGGVWFVTNVSLSSLVDWSMLLIITYTVWIGTWIFTVFRFRRKLDSLSKGDW